MLAQTVGGMGARAQKGEADQAKADAQLPVLVSPAQYTVLVRHVPDPRTLSRSVTQQSRLAVVLLSHRAAPAAGIAGVVQGEVRRRHEITGKATSSVIVAVCLNDAP